MRAFAMLVGVAYHATYAFMPGIGPYFPVASRETWSGFVVIAGIVHAVRMPVFFALSGFFAALVLERRPGQFLRDRFARLMVPFFVALPLSVVSDVAIRRFSFAQGTMHASFPGQGEWLIRPLHLWFLELVFLFCLAAKAWRASGLRLPFARWLAVPEVMLLGSVVTGGVVWLFGDPEPAQSFLPSPSTLFVYGPFFAFGFGVYGARASTDALRRRWPWWLVAGVASCLVIFSRPLQWQPEGKALAAVAAWLVVLGVVGWALAPSAKPPGLLVQSAYWVYLVHHPLVQLGQALVATTSWPAVISYSLVVSSVMLISLGAYVVVVSRTPLAAWLGAKPRTSAH